MSDQVEEAAALENQIVEAIMELVGDHGYTEEDLQRILRDAMTA